MFLQTASLGGTQGEIVLGSVREIAIAGRAILRSRKLGIVTLSAAGVFAVAAPVASATHLGDPVGISSSTGRIAYVAGDGQFNNVNVDLTATSYTITDTGLPGAMPDGNPSDDCTVSGQTATCPRDGVVQVFIEVGDLDDNVNGSPGDEVILGGPGGDALFGDAGDDFMDTGLGQPPGTPEEQFAQDTADGSGGFNTISFASRTESIRRDTAVPPNVLGVMVDQRPDRQITVDTDGSFKKLNNMQRIVGTQFDDEIVGGYAAEELVGGDGKDPRGDGKDTLCGGLGVDTVDYSDRTSPVHVTLDGDSDMPTDPDLAIQLVPDPDESTTGGALRDRYLRARHDCRQYTPSTGLPVPDCNNPLVINCTTAMVFGDRDCTADDGAWDGTTSEGDCVGEDVENIKGGSGDDVLVGNDIDPLEGRGPRIEPLGANRIEGGGGNDTMDGRGGPDVYEGGEGTDTVTYGEVEAAGRVFPGRTRPVNVTIDGVANDGGVADRNRAGLTDSVGTDVEGIVGGSADDVLRGDDDDPATEEDEGADILVGGDGNDFLGGNSGADRLEGGLGSDTLRGGPGNDLLLGGDGDDAMRGAGGHDGVHGEAGNDTVSGGAGADTLSGGDGADTLDYTDATTPLHVALDGVNNDGTAGEGDHAEADFERVLGGIANDTLTGGPGGERLEGGDGDDLLIGGGGPDQIYGGSGADTASYADRSTPVQVNLAEVGNDGAPGEGDHVAGDIEKVLGGSGDDTLLGDAAANVLLGAAGNDRLAGAEGDDLLIGGAGNDTIAGDVVNDTLFGSDGNDGLSGGDGNDDLKGEAGNDTMDGGPGRDRLTGGPHTDTLLYASRTAGVTVTLIGKDGNGESKENDFVAHDVENVTTGRGNDTIDADDNLKGEVKCGAGADVVTADPDDRIAGDCENVRVSALGTRCTASKGKATMSKSGVVPVRIFCAVTAKGSVRLQSVLRVKSGKGRRKLLKLGSKSFSLKAGQRKTIRVKTSKAARRYIQRKKRLSVRARISAKTRSQAKTSTVRSSSVFTVRAGR